MRIAVIGAGAMGAATVKDLCGNPEVSEILVADAALARANEVAAAIADTRIKAACVEAADINGTARMLAGYSVVTNAAQYYVNCEVMKACLQARCHYNDLGGMFHMTRRQHELFDEFRRAGLSAITGMGAAPGITNVLSRYGYDLLDRVEAVHTSFAAADLSEQSEVLVPPYSIRTIMEEMADDSVQYLDGNYVARPALSGAEVIDFPDPIGRRTCYHTLHSEPATIPAAFHDKGVREVTWRLSLPPILEDALKTLARAGFASAEPIDIGGTKLTPREILAMVLERHIAEKGKMSQIRLDEVACIRSRVQGIRDKHETEVTVDCIASTPAEGTSLVGFLTGTPASIAAQMQARGDISSAGVWGSESVIDPSSFFAQLARRGMRIESNVREILARP